MEIFSNNKYIQHTQVNIPSQNQQRLKCDCDGIKVIGSRAGRNPTRVLDEVKKMHQGPTTNQDAFFNEPASSQKKKERRSPQTSDFCTPRLQGSYGLPLLSSTPASYHHAPSFTLEGLQPLGPYTSHFPLSHVPQQVLLFPNTHVDPREKTVESRVIQLPTFNYLPCDRANLLFYS